MRARRSALFACAVLLTTHASANAATVTYEPGPAYRLVYRAAPGEPNAVSAKAGFDADRSGWTITDTGASTIAAPPWCTHTDAHTIHCAEGRHRAISFVDIDLGDLDDRFSRGADEAALAAAVRVRGGPGDDVLDNSFGYAIEFWGQAGDDVLTVATGIAVLNGGRGDDRVYGGLSADRLDGGGGRDELHGGGDDDVLADGDRDGATGDAGPGPDLLDGGPGLCCGGTRGDRVSYKGRRRPILVDLADPRADGESGEGDVLIGIEGVEGGRGADRLLGDLYRNHLVGGAGADVLAGRGHSDTLEPGSGPARVSCGRGDDRVGPTTTQHRLARDCELVRVAREFTVRARPRRGGPGRLTYSIGCPPKNPARPHGRRRVCWGRLQLREARGAERLLGVGVFPHGRWSARRVSIVLTPRGHRLAGRRTPTTLRLRLATYAGLSPVVLLDRIRWTIRQRF